MELPHLTLYLRRLAAPLPWRGGWRAVLAAPGARLWLILAGWLALGAAFVLGRHWLDNGAGADFNGIVSFGLVTGINLALYLPLTTAMAAVVDEPGTANGKWLRELNPPLWYLSLTLSWRAVLGTLCVALLSIAPTALGATLLLAARDYFSFHDLAASRPLNSHTSQLLLFQSSQMHWDWIAFLWNDLGALLRMPQLACATAALCLALRRTTFATSIPLAMTVTACLAATAGQTWGGGELWGGGPNHALAFILAGSVTLFAGMNLLLRRLAAAEQVAPGMLGALFGLCILPCVLSGAGLATGEMPGAGNLRWAVTLTAYHIFCSGHLPDLQPIGLTVNQDYQFRQVVVGLGPGPATLERIGSGRLSVQTNFFGLDVPLAFGLAASVMGYLLSLAFWFWTAVQCLDAARGQVKRGAK